MMFYLQKEAYNDACDESEIKEDTMQLYPAIDIKNGQCVRLTQGLFHDIKVYSDAPEQVASFWQEQGATFLHLVDLDGALAGHSVNEAAIRKIVQSVSIPIQIGGGIRSKEAIRSMLSLGISRVIIGTKAVENPEFIKDMVAAFGSDKIVVGIDGKNGMVAVEGWEKVSTIEVSKLCEQMKSYGVKHVVYTDISRDGMLSGPNITNTMTLTKEYQMNIIASGGVSSMEDLQKLKDAGIKGAIIGKALYEKRIDLSKAIKCFQ